MKDKESALIIFNKSTLKYVLIIYIICGFLSVLFFSALKLFGFNDNISINSLIMLGIIAITYAVVFGKCYRCVINKNGFNMKAFNITKYMIVAATYFQYLYLNFTMHLNSLWLMVFFFVALGALFFDVKMIAISLFFSVICQVIVFINNPSIFRDNEFVIAESAMRIIVIVLSLSTTFLIVYFASELLKVINKKEVELKEENEKLMFLFKEIGEISNDVLVSSENLSVAIEEQTTSLQEVSEVSQSIGNDSEEILNKSNKNKDILNNLLDNNKTVASKAKDSEHEIKEFINVTDKNEESLNNTLSIIGDIKSSIEDTFKSTKDLEEKSKQVDEILNLIGDISEETNLLALNASIEAARAGEYGKGFAVVAEEIRKLAEGTKQSLNQVSVIVNELKDNINIVQGQMTGNNEKVQVGNSIINETVKQLNNMTSDLRLFGDNILEINKASSTLLKETKNVVEFNEKVANVTTDTIAKYEVVTEAIAQSTATSEEIEASINELRNIAEEMNKLTQ